MNEQKSRLIEAYDKLSALIKREESTLKAAYGSGMESSYGNLSFSKGRLIVLSTSKPLIESSIADRISALNDLTVLKETIYRNAENTADSIFKMLEEFESK